MSTRSTIYINEKGNIHIYNDIDGMVHIEREDNGIIVFDVTVMTAKEWFNVFVRLNDIQSAEIITKTYHK